MGSASCVSPPRDPQLILDRVKAASAVCVVVGVSASSLDAARGAQTSRKTVAKTMAHFDLVVIGGGSGGSGVCKRALGYGKSVCIIDRGVRYEDGERVGAGVGGTCVNVGCVPKKLMFMAASVREEMVGSAEIASGFGFAAAKAACGEMTVDWPGLKEKRDAYVKRLNGVYEGGWTKLGAVFKLGTATLQGTEGGKSTVKVVAHDGTEESITADHVVFAVGGVPSVPDVPGKELGITSDGFFDLPEQPKKCGVFGAGYIAVEMAGILNALGTDTTLFCRGDKPLRNEDVFDASVVETLVNEMAKHGPTLRPKSDVASLTKAADGTTTVTLKDGTVIEGFDCILWAIGRHPVTSGLGLEEAGVELNRGFVVVDEYENTKVPGIYALGDCTTTGWELTPVAIAAGRRLGDRLFGGEPLARMVYTDVPTVIFSHPPIGTIGYTEAKAKKEFGEDKIVAKKATFGSMLYAFNPDEGKTKTTLKLVMRLPEETIIGLHMIGPYSDEMLQGFAIAVKMGATRRDFEATCAIHPTIGEEMVTFGGWGQLQGKPQLPPQIQPANANEEVVALRAEVAALKAQLAAAGK